LKDILKFGLVLGLAAYARLVTQHAGGLRLADALSGVGFDGLGGRESDVLTFRHVPRIWLQDEYG
jgi:hypothetical protein